MTPGALLCTARRDQPPARLRAIRLRPRRSEPVYCEESRLSSGEAARGREHCLIGFTEFDLIERGASVSGRKRRGPDRRCDKERRVGRADRSRRLPKSKETARRMVGTGTRDERTSEGRVGRRGGPSTLWSASKASVGWRGDRRLRPASCAFCSRGGRSRSPPEPDRAVRKASSASCRCSGPRPATSSW